MHSLHIVDVLTPRWTSLMPVFLLLSLLLFFFKLISKKHMYWLLIY
jgi:hypothetical protein